MVRMSVIASVLLCLVVPSNVTSAPLVKDVDVNGLRLSYVDALEYEDWKTRAILDFHTAAITLRGTANLTGAPPAIGSNNSARQFCSSATFTNPVDITSVVSNLTGAFDPANAPAAGFASSDTVKDQMAAEAVDFFREKLSPAE